MSKKKQRSQDKWDRGDRKLVYSPMYFKPKTERQSDAINYIRKHQLNFVEGPPGVAKTFLGCVHAMELFQKGAISKIVLIRPAVEAGKSLGYLPGTQEEKMYPYLLPIYDNLSKIVDNYVLESMFENEQIEVLSPTLARGRTLDNSYMIVDEAQNLSKDHLRMILTRIGEGTWCFVSMDGGQIDIQKQNSCFNDMHLFRDRDDIGHFLFTKDDVVRSKLAQMVVNIYEEQLDNSPEL